MFLSHFNLTQHPFMENPPIDWILTDPRIEQALARLKFCLSITCPRIDTTRSMCT